MSLANRSIPRVARFTGNLLFFGALCTVAFAQTVSVNFNSSPGNTPPYGLGIGTAVYDGSLMDAAVPGLIKTAGYNIVRYPGGSYADIYHWQTNTATGGGYVVAADTFDNFMSQVKAAGATALITTNYGSNAAGNAGGDPNEAAAWVTYSKSKGYGIKYWEVGNEIYGNGFYGAQWEEDLHTDHSPTAYGNNVVAFAKAMKAADSTIKVGAVLTTPNNWPDAQSPSWDATVIPIVCGSADFVIMHWYPGTNQLFTPETDIPTISSTARARLNQYCPSHASSMEIWLTEGNWNGTQIPGALFAADQFLAWWENGVVSMDWQNLHNGIYLSNGVNEDSGVLSNGSCSGSTCEPPTDTPFPAYYAAQMVHELTAPGDTLLSATSSSTNVAVHAVKNGSGKLAIMLINKTGGALSVPVAITGTNVSSTGTEYLYGQSTSSVQSSSISGLGSSFTISVPANSILDIVTTTSGGGGGGNLIANGTYTITNRNSNLVMDDPASSVTAGTRIEQYASNGGNNQKWQLTNLGNNNVTLVCLASHLALDVSGASKSNGGEVIQWTPTGAANQTWHIVSLGGGFYEIVNQNSSLALEVPGSSTASKAFLDQSAYTGGASQQWSIH